MQVHRRKGFGSTASFARCAGGIICVLWFGARLVVKNKLSPGELSTFVIYAVYVGSNVGALAGVVSSLVQVCSSQKHCHSQSPAHTAFSWLCCTAFAQSCMGNCSVTPVHTNSRVDFSKLSTCQAGLIPADHSPLPTLVSFGGQM